uniref:Uncharacterized protein n=1 Tax=Cacopsylla melanoneura TaxID=428564 RepID=A0A8D8ZD16_9HEMI
MKILRTPNYRYKLLEMDLKKPIIDIVTRWNTTHDMLKSFLELRPFWGNHFKDIPQIFLEKVETVVAVLQPAKDATIKLQQEQLTLGDFVKTWMEMKLKVENMRNSWSQCLLDCIKQREKSLLENEVVLAAIYLDPRICKLFPLEKTQQTKRFLKNVASHMIEVSTCLIFY